jgi:transcriptional regulator with XRE-family HTH domain
LSTAVNSLTLSACVITLPFPRPCPLRAMPDATATSTLGNQLGQLRDLRGQTLRTVAEAAGISGAYLLKLERDDVQSPSPHVLRRLAAHFHVSYLGLMDLAGYDVTDEERQAPAIGVLADALAAEPLTREEQRAVAAFLTTLRAQPGR